MGPFHSSVLEIKTSVTNKVEEVNETSTIYAISELGNVYGTATMLTNMQATVASTTWIPSSMVISRNILNGFVKNQDWQLLSHSIEMAVGRQVEGVELGPPSEKR